MTLSELSMRLAARLDENGSTPVYYSQPQLTAALNEAQLMFTLLTLCLEKTVQFPLPAKTPYAKVLCLMTDWLMAKRIKYRGISLRPSRLSELDSLDAYWQTKSGDPQRYAAVGFDMLAFYPQAPSPVTFDVTYYHVPAQLKGVDDVPQIPEVYHSALLDYAEYVSRQGEGGDEFAKTLPRLEAFLSQAQQAQAHFKAVNMDSRYEVKPYELTRQDRSRLLNWRPNLGQTEPLTTEAA